MSYQIAICLAATAIGISCIAPDASARGGGGGGHGVGGPMAVASVSKSYNSVNTNGVTKSYKSVNTNFPSGGSTNTLGNGQKIIPRTLGAGGPTGTPSGGGVASSGGGAGGAAYYAPASYSSNTACGRYPYPPCKKVPTR
jgi:hypothetical protein